MWVPSCAVDNFCIRVTRGWWECTPSTKTFVDLASCAVDFLVSNEAAKRARRSPPASAAPDTLSSATCLRAWRLGNSTLQRDRRKRLAKQHLAGAEDSVDAVYMALAGAAHAQANAAASGGAWSSARLVAEDYVDAVYMALAAAARLLVGPPCTPPHPGQAPLLPVCKSYQRRKKRPAVYPPPSGAGPAITRMQKLSAVHKATPVAKWCRL